MDSLEDRVMDLVAFETGCPRRKLSLDTTIEGDLRTTGDDAWELIERLHKEFQIDFTAMQFDRHFDPEVPPHSIAGAIWWVAGIALMVLAAIWMEPVFGRLTQWPFFILFVPFLMAWMWLARYRPDERRRRARKIPVTLRHLVEAARTKTWPFSYLETSQ